MLVESPDQVPGLKLHISSCIRTTRDLMLTFTHSLLELKGIPHGTQFTALIFFRLSHYAKDNGIKINLNKFIYKQLNSY